MTYPQDRQSICPVDCANWSNWRRSPTCRPPAVTRVLFTRARSAGTGILEDALRRGRACRARRRRRATCSRAGPGREPDLPAVATGSHTDAIPFSGQYDGTVGVLGGLEAIRALQAAGWQPAAVHRADHVHQRGADSLRHRLPGQPAAVRARLHRADGRRSRTATAQRFDEVRRQAGCDGRRWTDVRLPHGSLRRVRRTAHRAGAAAGAPADPHRCGHGDRGARRRCACS